MSIQTQLRLVEHISVYWSTLFMGSNLLRDLDDMYNLRTPCKRWNSTSFEYSWIHLRCQKGCCWLVKHFPPFFFFFKFFFSKLYLWAVQMRWLGCPCSGVSSMGKPVLTAAWPGILIAPGMAPPAPIISPLTRGIFLFDTHMESLHAHWHNAVYCMLPWCLPFIFLILNMNSSNSHSETVPEADI